MLNSGVTPRPSHGTARNSPPKPSPGFNVRRLDALMQDKHLNGIKDNMQPHEFVHLLNEEMSRDAQPCQPITVENLESYKKGGMLPPRVATSAANLESKGRKAFRDKFEAGQRERASQAERIFNDARQKVDGQRQQASQAERDFMAATKLSRATDSGSPNLESQGPKATREKFGASQRQRALQPKRDFMAATKLPQATDSGSLNGSDLDKAFAEAAKWTLEMQRSSQGQTQRPAPWIAGASGQMARRENPMGSACPTVKIEPSATSRKRSSDGEESATPKKRLKPEDGSVAPGIGFTDEDKKAMAKTREIALRFGRQG